MQARISEIIRPLFAFTVMLFLAFGAEAWEKTGCIEKVCVVASGNDQEVLVIVENGRPDPVGVRVKMKRLKNLERPARSGKNIILENTAPPKGRAVLGSFRVIHPRKPYDFDLDWKWVQGDPLAEPDASVRYRIPFGGKKPHMLTQGVNGKFSHKGTGRYAFDFELPIGTPIVAARSGTVMAVEDGRYKAGLTEDYLTKANAVTVLHDDGTYAVYAHLDPGAGARAGARVYTGDVIGFSGNTGFSTGPHLHFMVGKASFDSGFETIPIRYYNARPEGFVPKTRKKYRPTCHKGGLKCLKGEIPKEKRVRSKTYVEKSADGTCRCKNGAVITVKLPCHMVCPGG